MPSRPNAEKQIFITYDSGDATTARLLANALRKSGLQTSLGEWELQPMESISERVSRDLATSDFLLVLFSPASVHSRWVREELLPFMSRELDERAITVIPIRTGGVELPPALATRQYFDVDPASEESIARIVSRIRSVPLVDWSRLSAQSFEALVGELLIKRGFSVMRTPHRRDLGFDFVASYTASDPFGGEKAETWLIEAKFYKESRVSVAALRQIMGVVYAHPKATKAAVLTNGQLTSAAKEFLSSPFASKADLRVLDGTTLTALISEYPDLCSRFFAAQPNE